MRTRLCPTKEQFQMSNNFPSLQKDPSKSESYNLGVDLKRIAVVVLIIGVVAIAFAIQRTGNTIKYISDAEVIVTECGIDEHQNYRPLSYRRYRNRSRYEVYFIKFQGTFEDGSELDITQTTNRQLYMQYKEKIDRGSETLKVYRSDDTGRYYLTSLEPEAALKEYQSINKGTIETACRIMGQIALIVALIMFYSGERMRKKALSYIPHIPMSPEREEWERAEEQRMYDEASKIFDER